MVSGDLRALFLHDHVVSWVDGPQDLDRLAVSVFAASGGERLVYVVDDPDPQRLEGLEDVDRLLDRGHLQLMSVDAIYRGAAFDPMDRLATFTQMLDETLAAGYEGLRVVADATAFVSGSEKHFAGWMTWEYLADRFHATNPVLGVCAIDTRRVSEQRVADLAAIHPVLTDGCTPCCFQLFSDGRGAMKLIGVVDPFSVDQFRRVLAHIPTDSDLAIDVSGAEFLDHRVLEALGNLESGVRVQVRDAGPTLRKAWEALGEPSDRMYFAQTAGD
ncbi:MAG TPA: MEDS domain-containing protein [Acidimicrobiales bacterium]|nr:MEDS domain-containing protein [Acidimicrobiales bacterium]